MMMALAVEESGLQERIALRILLLMGSNPRWFPSQLNVGRTVDGVTWRIMLGFSMATAFLSMWMSNTATTGSANFAS